MKIVTYDYVHEKIKQMQINVREYLRGNQKWTIQKNWQQDEEKQNKNTTQYVLDNTYMKKYVLNHFHEEEKRQFTRDKEGVVQNCRFSKLRNKKSLVEPLEKIYNFTSNQQSVLIIQSK